MGIEISSHFSYRKLMRFVFPSIATMIFLSTYSIIDGFFVSNYVGDRAFAAINLIFPALGIFGCVGAVIGAGGSALIGKRLGQQRIEEACSLFSSLSLAGLTIGVVLATCAWCVMPWIASGMGAEGEMLRESVFYGRILLISFPMHLLQRIYHSFAVTSGKPPLAFWTNVASGVINLAFDYLFIVCFGWAVAGAAWATVLAEFTGGLLPVLYFILHRDGVLHLGYPQLRLEDFLKVCSNGISQFLTGVSMSFLAMVYNYQLLRFVGEKGVAAFGVIMYISFVFESAYLGYAQGIAPVISYNYGADNRKELGNVFRKSLMFYAVTGALVTIGSLVFASPLAWLFTGYSQELYALTLHGLRLYALSFTISGFPIFAASFFTALNNGPVAAEISVCQSILFELIAVVMLPLILGVDGIWVSVDAANVAAVILSVYFWKRYQPRYGY